MKAERLWNSLTGIREDYITEAAPDGATDFTALRRKKTVRLIRWAGIAACFLLVTALTLSWVLQSNDKPVEYVIYGEFQTFDDASADVGNLTARAMRAQVEAAERLDVYRRNSQKIENSSASATKSLNIDGISREYTLKWSESTDITNCSNEAMQKYGTVDTYGYDSDTATLIAEYNQNGTLVYYSDLGREFIPGDLTDGEAKNISQKLIQNIYGKEVAAEYTFDRISTNDDGFRYVFYTKKICGYSTLDYIRIKLHGNGQLKAINANQRGIFNTLEKSITAEKIDAAKKALMEQVGEDWEPKHLQLAVGADGKCYLEASEEYINIFYINID